MGYSKLDLSLTGQRLAHSHDILQAPSINPMRGMGIRRMMGLERVGLILTARRHWLLKLWGGVTRECRSGKCNFAKLSEVRHTCCMRFL